MAPVVSVAGRPSINSFASPIAGVRMVEVEVPTATYTGWGLRAGPAAGDGCDAAGQKIDFPRTKAERLATGDPRRSIEERYPDHEKYVKMVTKAAEKLEKQGFLLDEDVRRYIEAADASSIGK
jgi:hypothetical protein